MPSLEPAATVLLLRERERGLEVLVVERNGWGQFGSMVVFPGGRVDAGDVPSGAGRDDDRSLRNAALRELAEEVGILLTADGPVASPPLRGSEFWQHAAADQPDLAPADLTLVSRWVTPAGMPRRFDTWFYTAACDDDITVRLDERELIGFEWVRPDSALQRQASGAMRMVLPTIAHLRWLERFTTIEDAFASAVGAEGRAVSRPRVLEDGSIVRTLLPDST